LPLKVDACIGSHFTAASRCGDGADDVVNLLEGGGGSTITVGTGNNDTVTLSSLQSSEKITLGDGDGDAVYDASQGGNAITLGNGVGDSVDAAGIDNNIILGNGNNDVVNDQGSANTITVGKGNDTVYVGNSDSITVGSGQDGFVFEQTTPGSIGTVTVTGFNPNKDSFTFSNQLTTSVSYHDDSHGNAVVTVDNAGDTITLMGVHSSELHPSDFHFVDPAALPTAPSPAQTIAELTAHLFV
jgi:Ca2+-binding RTX toxin-like protein